MSTMNTPSPPRLPPDQQREFEELFRAAHESPSSEGELAPQADARNPADEFEGNVNPVTGEEGGPKQEPVRRWVQENDGDWSFKGRVSDF